MEGLLFFVCKPQNEEQESEASEHLCLIIVLVIEHLVHGVGTENQEGNVNVPTNLEEKPQ